MKKLISHCFNCYRNFRLRKKCVLQKSSYISASAIIINPSKKNQRIRIGHKSHICGTLIVWENAGQIEIGNHSYIGEYTRIISALSIKIGDRVQIAHNCNIFDSNIHSLNPKERHLEFISNTSSRLTKIYDLNEKPVTIKDDAWIGANSIILKGVTIGKAAIIGAGSVVLNDVPDYTVFAGNPAKLIKLLSTADCT